MRDVEAELREMLFERAERVSPPATMHNTLRRTRVRQVVTGAAAGTALVLLVLGGVTAARVLSGDRQQIAPREDAIQTDGPYGFTSYPGEYPTVAAGEFRGAEWELTSTRVMRADGLESLHVALSITSGDDMRTEDFFVLGSDEILTTESVAAADVLDGPDALFGVTIRNVADTVAVEVASGDEPTIPAHIFRDYDSRSEFTVDFWMAFVPADDPAFVLARDPLGTDLDRDSYGDVSLPKNVVATGKQGMTFWRLAFEEEGQRACFVFSAEEEERQCYTREQMDDAGPLLVSVFDTPGTRGVMAILSEDVGNVRVGPDGQPGQYMPWLEPPRDEMGRWPIRFVVVGLPPGTAGKLVAWGLAGDQKPLAEVEF